MFSLNNIASETGSRKKSKRLGRWNGSGKWTYCGRGLNWQNSRSGGWVPAWFEWGQTPLFRRMPKLKGFSNAVFMKNYSLVNLTQLEILAQKWVLNISVDTLVEHGIVKNKSQKVKVLGNGDISAKISLKVDKISSSAQEKITKAGGSVELNS